jgi:hypothetical protein
MVIKMQDEIQKKMPPKIYHNIPQKEYIFLFKVAS